MAMIQNDWLDVLKPEFSKPYYRQLFQFVQGEYSRAVVYPPADDIFNAFHFTPLSEVKVLLLGQDPYHNEHQAHGMSFTVLPTRKKYLRLYRIFIRNCMMIWDAVYPIMAI